MRIFYFIAYSIALKDKSVHHHVSALNGVGNIHYARGEFLKAIEHCEKATLIDPYYCYAWHDLFIAYYMLARYGEIRLESMRNALEKTRETGKGQPGLGSAHLKQLDQMFAEYDPAKIILELIQEGTRVPSFKDLSELAKTIGTIEPLFRKDFYRIQTIQ